MAALLSSALPEIGLRVLLTPLGGNVITRTACCTVGIAFPVYSTFKAIEKRDQSEQERWLLYWAAYGSFSLVEGLSDKFVSWVPFYYQLKFAFLVWLQVPSGNGAKHLYRRYLRPFLLRHQERLDQIYNSVSSEIIKFAIAHQGEIQFLKAIFRRCTCTANQVLKEVSRPLQPRRQIDGPDGHTRQSAHDHDSDAEN